MLARLGDEVAAVLAAHAVPKAVVEAEREHMSEHRIAATANRSVVGVITEFTFLADTFRAEARPDLLGLAVRLSRTPCRPLYRSHVSPDRELAALVGSLRKA